MRRHPSSFALALLAALGAALVAAVPAAAHVSVRPPQADRGSDAALTFRVPNERPDAATVEVAIQLPVPFERVHAPEVDGWTAEVSGDTVRWTGGRIEGSAAVELPLALGPLPADDRLVFKAVQTYDSGEVVRWTGSPGDDHPAPVLTLTGVAPTTTVPTTTTISTVDDDAADPDAAPAPGVADDDGGGLVTTGLVVGLVLVLLALGSYALTRRRAARRAGAPPGP